MVDRLSLGDIANGTTMTAAGDRHGFPFLD
jgi:hypothetical protein